MGAEFDNLNRSVIQNCYMEFPDKGFSMPVAQFSAEFALDEIPTAAVVPALGRNIITGTQTLLKQVSEGDTVELKLRMDGSDRLILRGFVSSISASDNAGLFARTLSAVVNIKHQLVKLGGYPPVSYTYGKNYRNKLEASFNRLAQVGRFSSGQGEKQNLLDISYAITRLKGKYTPSVSSFPGTVMKEWISWLMETMSPELTKPIIDANLITYDPANFTPFIPIPDLVMKEMHDTFGEGWETGNLWEALKKTSSDLFMHIIPYNTGMHLANPYALLRTPLVNLSSKEYVSMSESIADNLTEPVDGVVLRSPMGNATDIVFPALTNQVAPTSPDNVEDKYYHFRGFPSWLHPMRAYLGTPMKRSTKITDRTAGIALKPDVALDSLVDYYNQVGVRIARIVYSEMALKKAAIKLRLPWREDLMPGTNVKLTVDNQEDISFIGDSLHGMITRTEFSCGNVSEPFLHVEIDIGSIRNEEDNAKDDPPVTFTEHPIFEGLWVGTELDGSYLTTVPTSQHPSLISDRTMVGAGTGKGTVR